MESIGVCEAKIHLTQLLKRVVKGEKITITEHGVPVATLQTGGFIEKGARARSHRSIERVSSQPPPRRAFHPRHDRRRTALMFARFVLDNSVLITSRLLPNSGAVCPIAGVLREAGNHVICVMEASSRDLGWVSDMAHGGRQRHGLICYCREAGNFPSSLP